jgi:hypothetical protein
MVISVTIGVNVGVGVSVGTGVTVGVMGVEVGKGVDTGLGGEVGVGVGTQDATIKTAKMPMANILFQCFMRHSLNHENSSDYFFPFGRLLLLTSTGFSSLFSLNNQRFSAGYNQIPQMKL